MSSDINSAVPLLVASTAAVSCALTALAAWHLIPRYLDHHQDNSKSQHRDLITHDPGVGNNSRSLFSPVNARKRPDPYDICPRNDYLSWDDYFMAVAFLSAERSKDPNKQVGACIVNEDNIILSIGYNGFPRGCPDSKLPWAKKAASGSILDTKYPYVVHAEANALLNKNQAQVSGSRIYVTLFPCNECAKLLIQAGIKEVVFHEAKLEPTGKRPATMEQAAAADTAEDDNTPAATCSSTNCQDCNHSHDHSAEVQQGQAVNGDSHKREQKFSVGASSDVDASYVASQRLLTMAGVKLRQHALKRTVQLPPGGAR